MSDAVPGREEILVMAKYAGLELPPAFQDELVDAYANVRRMVARLPRARHHGDEPAHSFDPRAFLPAQEA